jgi:hypothetical protein
MAAGFKAYKSGAWYQATKISCRHSAAWVEVLRIRMWHVTNNQGQWVDVYVKSGTTPTPTPSPTPTPTPTPPSVLTVSITPSPIAGHSNGGPTVTTNQTATAAASGGTAPYFYHWDLISWTASTPPFANSPDAAITTFTQNGLDDNVTMSAVFRVTVHDGNNSVGTASVSVYFNTTVKPIIGDTR